VVVGVSFAELPEVLTIEEAAKVLRIGRGAAYTLARRYRATRGRQGLPVVEFGRSLRVPRRALEAILADPGRLWDSGPDAGYAAS
jgi:hypothetical protein